MSHLHSIVLRSSDPKLHGARLFLMHDAWVSNSSFEWILAGRAAKVGQKQYNNVVIIPVKGCLWLLGVGSLEKPGAIENMVERLQEDEDARCDFYAEAFSTLPDLDARWHSRGKPREYMSLFTEVLGPNTAKPQPSTPAGTWCPALLTPVEELQRRARALPLRGAQGTDRPLWDFTGPVAGNPFVDTPPAQPSRQTAAEPPAQQPLPAAAEALPSATPAAACKWPNVPDLVTLHSLLDSVLGPPPKEEPARKQAVRCWHFGPLEHEEFNKLRPALQNTLLQGVPSGTPRLSGAEKKKRKKQRQN